MKVSNKAYELIGQLSIEYNRLQFFTSYLYNSFKKSSKTGFVLIENKGFPTLLNKIKSYVSETKISQENKNEILSLVDRIDNFRKERNAYVHAIILKTKKDLIEKAIFIIESLKQNKTVEKVIDQNKIEKLIDEGATLCNLVIRATVFIERKNITGV